jgi:hypothetical protein
MDQDNEAFNPNDKEQLRDFINEVVAEWFLRHQKYQEKIAICRSSGISSKINPGLCFLD